MAQRITWDMPEENALREELDLYKSETDGMMAMIEAIPKDLPFIEATTLADPEWTEVYNKRAGTPAV